MTKGLLASVLILGVALMVAGTRILQLERDLAAKPKIEVREIVKTVVKRVAGPVQVREVIRTLPGGERIVERVIERGEVTTDTGKESDKQRSEAPACAPAGQNSRFIGLVLDPRLETKVEGARAGLTIFGRLDLAAGYRFQGRAVGPFADAAFRF